jgi:coatomer protein complex subunit epsilon
VEALLDELRDLCIEVETEEYDQATSSSGLVKVAAATAFVRENELEEALTTLGAGTGTKDIEWSVLAYYLQQIRKCSFICLCL